MNNRRKTYFTCLKCAGKQFSRIRLAKHHLNNYHKVKGREAYQSVLPRLDHNADPNSVITLILS
jgi:hypothetical protein